MSIDGRSGSILIVDRPLSAPAREALRVIAVLRSLPYENKRPETAIQWQTEKSGARPMDAGKKKGNFWWPDVSTEEGARDAAKGGATGAAIIAVVTAGFALYAAFSSPVMGVITPWSFLDAGLFAVIAFGIWRMSRVAAVAGLALYLIEQAYMWASVGPKNPVMSLLFIMFLIGGVRGTVSFQKHRKAARSAGIAN